MSGQAKFGLENLFLEDIGACQRVFVRLQKFLQGCIHLDLDVHIWSGFQGCKRAMRMLKTTLESE